jgi:hypothetical protein
MPQQKYEVRGLKFISSSNNMAMSHRCTFAVSLHLPSGSYWVSHYLFLDDSGYSDHVQLSDPASVVAKGSSALPGYLYSDALWPKEVLEPANWDVPRSKAKLRYIRAKGATGVVVHIDVWAKRKQTVQFNMLQETAAPADETIELDGKVSISEQSDYTLQILQRGPWGSPRNPAYSPG